MKGLMIKDFYILWKRGKILLAVLAVYTFMSFYMSQSFTLSFMVVMISITLPMTAMAYDERGRFDAYACALPVSRTAVIRARYLMALLLILGGTVFSLAVSVVFALVQGGGIQLEAMVAAGASLLVALFYLSLILPFIVWLGTEKARIIMMAVFLVPFLSLFLFEEPIKRLINSLPEETLFRTAVIILPLAAVLFFVLSYFISVRLYRRKEF